MRADLAVSLTLTQSVEVRGCCSWSSPGVSYVRHTHSVFLSNSLHPFLFSSLKRHVFPPIFCIHLHFEIYIFLGFKCAANGARCQSPLRFFCCMPLISPLQMCELQEEAGKSQSVCAAFGTGRGVFQRAPPPEVALLVFSDQSNALIGSRLVPHTPLSSPDFINH